MHIQVALKNILEGLPEEVKLVAVSKTKPNNIIMQAYQAGHRVFGENKVQELAAKYESLPKDIEWHMIGHLQSNKVKYIAPFVYMIHGVDSLKLLKVINTEALKNNRIIKCLLQVKIASEESKFGLSEDDVEFIFKSEVYAGLKNIEICGLMGMATYTDNMEVVRAEFKKLYSIFKRLQGDFFKNSTTFNQLSMGMSGDYKIAVEEGSTMVRIGSLIFGERNYK